MKILALEFSSSQRSVAVVQAGPTSTERSAGAVGRPGSTAPDGIRSDAIVVAEVVETGAGTAQPLGMIDDALRQLRNTQQKLAMNEGSFSGTNVPVLSKELEAKVRSIGLKAFYSQSSAQTKAELAPVLEELQKVMESGRPFHQHR